jgi:two-component system, cell cycle sensor histidine kinase and response regulator CckA
MPRTSGGRRGRTALTGTPVKTVAMFEAIPLGLATLDDDDCIMWCNPAFIASFGIVGNSTGLDPADLLVPADRELLTEAFERARASETGVVELRVRLVLSPDESVTLTIAHAPPGLGGDGTELMIAVRDIREQLRLEAQVAQVTKMQAVGQLAGGVAHDFNNVLTAILGLCDHLLTRHLPGSYDFDDIDQIRQNANRAAALVRQLLAFARQQTLQVQSVDVTEILDRLRALLHRLVGPSIAIEINYGHGSWAIRADPGQFEQVIVNLAVNARDAMSGGGRLVFTTRAIPGSAVAALGHRIMPGIDLVEISVRDTGHGIAPAISAKIFEPFFTTKPVGRGTGLGLSSVYGIIKQSGGFIFMSQPQAGGTKFDVYLPADAVVEASAPVALAPAAVTKLQGVVLLVEDERAVRMVVERALKHIGLDVHVAVDGETALAKLAELDGRVDLLVSDVVMPGMDGVTLANAAQQTYPALRVILMSGYSEPPQRTAVGQHGTFFLSKPFSIAELEAKIRVVLT